MRNDLRRACRHCALRLPEGCTTCPRCRWPTTTPAQALESLGSAKQSLRVDRPVRDALIHVPAALMYVAGVVAGIYASVVAGLELGAEGGGLVVVLVVLLLPTVFSATVVVLALPWAVWAGLVTLVSWISSRRKPRSVLRPAPFATVLPDLPIRASWFDRAKQWLRRHWLRKAALGFAGLFLLELVAELLSKNPFGAEDPVGVLKVAASTILFQLIVVAVLAIPLSMVLQGLVTVQGKLERLAHVWRERRRDRALTDPAAGTAPLRSGRPSLRGAARAEPAPSCVAPLSGRRCLGFRLVGRAGLALIDDAEMGPLLVHGEEDAVVRGRRVVLVLPDPVEILHELTPPQRERVAAFLGRCGLPPADDVELGETLLSEGDEVVAHGTPATEPVGSGDYRTSTTRRVLDDADGLPVLVERD